MDVEEGCGTDQWYMGSKRLATTVTDDTDRYLLYAVERRHVLSSWVDSFKKQPCVEIKIHIKKHCSLLSTNE